MNKVVSLKCLLGISCVFWGAVAFLPSVMAASDKAPIAVPQSVTSTMQLGSFDAIVATGNLHLSLQQVGKSSSHTLHITHVKNQSYSIVVKDHVLTIKQTTPWWQRVMPAVISVDVGTLNQLKLVDAASLTATGINTSSLTIDADTIGNISIEGKVGLTSLVSKGPGDIRVSWVDSPLVEVDSYGAGTITLSGTAGELRARMSGHSTLDAKNLRVDKVMVQTKRFARALVMPLLSLQAYAHDFSNIFYYKTPKHFSRMTGESGNVLQLQWRQQ